MLGIRGEGVDIDEVWSSRAGSRVSVPLFLRFQFSLIDQVAVGGQLLNPRLRRRALS